MWTSQIEEAQSPWSLKRVNNCLGQWQKELILINDDYACLLSRFSCVWLCVTLWTVGHQAPLSMGFSRQECWSGLPLPSPGDLPDPGIEAGSPALQAEPLPAEPPGKPKREGRRGQRNRGVRGVTGAAEGLWVFGQTQHFDVPNKGNHWPKSTYGIGESICQLCNQQGVNSQNIQRAHTTQ